MQVRFWTKTGWRNGTVIRTLSRGKHKGWLVVQYPHGKGTKTLELDPTKATVIKANPSALPLLAAGAIAAVALTSGKPAHPMVKVDAKLDAIKRQLNDLDHAIDDAAMYGKGDYARTLAKRFADLYRHHQGTIAKDPQFLLFCQDRVDDKYHDKMIKRNLEIFKKSGPPDDDDDVQRNPDGAAPARRMGEWLITGEADAYDPVRRRKARGYWVRHGQTGVSGFMTPMGDEFVFQEQLDLFSQSPRGPERVTIGKIQTEKQYAAEAGKRSQMALFANPSVISTIHPGYRLLEVSTGEIFTIMGQGPKIRGVQRYVLKDDSGKMLSIRRQDLLDGQLSGEYVIKDIADRSQMKLLANPRRNPDVLTGRIRETDAGPMVRTFEQTGGKRHAVDIPVPRGLLTLPDWRRDLAHKPRKLSKPIPVPKVTVVERGAAGRSRRESPLVYHGPNGEVMGRAVTAGGNAIDYAWAIVPMESLITSHDPFDLRENKEFPQELQPRDRSRASYQDQITRLAANLDPSLLFWSANVSDGAPVVGPDRVVESGNGRTMALIRAYAGIPARAKAYKDMARAWADELGLQWPDGVQHPVLVRIRASKVNRAEFARAANVAGQQQMAAAEQALADAGQLSVDVILLYNPDAGLGTQANAPFVDAFIRTVAGPQARGDMITAQGKLSQSGEDRIRYAMFARAYGLRSEPLIESLAEDTESDLRTVLNGMVAVAPQWAAFVGAMDKGLVSKAYDITPAVIEMALLVRRAKDNNVTIDAQRAQVDAFNPTSREADLLALAAHPKGTRASAKSLAMALVEYMRRVEAQGLETQSSMFGDPPPPAITLLRQAVNAVLLGDEEPSASRAAKLAERIADPATVRLWPREWRDLVAMANPVRRVYGGRPQRNPAPMTRSKYPAPPITLPAKLPLGRTVNVRGHAVRALADGFVVVDGVRYLRSWR
jgi:hypothetical protein